MLRYTRARASQAPTESEPSSRMRGTLRGFLSAPSLGSTLGIPTDAVSSRSFKLVLRSGLSLNHSAERWNVNPARSRRAGTPKMAFMALGLLMLSDATREVSMVPGGWLSRTWYTKLSGFSRPPNTARVRKYWLPMLDDRFSHSGWAGSFGGLSGCGAAWQKAQLMPTR